MTTIELEFWPILSGRDCTILANVSVEKGERATRWNPGSEDEFSFEVTIAIGCSVVQANVWLRSRAGQKAMMDQFYLRMKNEV